MRSLLSAGARRLCSTALLCLLALAASTSEAQAIDFTVTKTADTNDGACNADCSLREAITAANLSPGADRVILGTMQPYMLALGRLAIVDALIIDGNGSTIDGAGLDRVLDIQGSFTITINNLRVTGGVASGVLSLGGGISIRNATVVLNGCMVDGNSTKLEDGSRDDGGGIAAIGTFDPAGPTTTIAGLTLNNSTVSGNTGANGGGIVCVLCALTVSKSTISGNAASSGDGGGIDLVGNSSTLSMTGSTLSGNVSTGGAARGGGLSVPFGTSSSTVSRSRITANTGAAASGIFGNIGSINAINNWWGCNYGPGAGGAGCAATPNLIAGTVTASPYLVLKASAAPPTVVAGASTTMTADLRFNSSSADTSPGGTLPDGTIASFSGTHGTFATPSAPTAGGKASDVYTAGSATTAGLSVAVDAQTLSISVLSVADFDSDARTDLTVFRPSTGLWYVLKSAGGFSSYVSYSWGASGDKPVPGDYDGDGKTDAAVYRPSTGTWWILFSSTNYTTYRSVSWGIGTDTPVPGDYDGDGRTDLAVFRPSTGTWFILYSSTDYATYRSILWGVSTDVVTPGDYDGDGRNDLAVYRPSTGTWFILFSGVNYTTYMSKVWGVATDVSVPGDYDGDGKTDIAVYRPSTSQWFVLRSSSNYTIFTTTLWGASTDTAVPGDYDGDGRTDIAVFRPSSGTWYLLYSNANYTTSAAYAWGAAADIPIIRRP